MPVSSTHHRYIPMKLHIFQWRFSMCFSVTVPACGCMALLHVALLQFHLTPTLMSFLFSVTSPIGNSGPMDAGEMQTVRMRTHIFSSLLFLLLLFFSYQSCFIGWLSKHRAEATFCAASWFTQGTGWRAFLNCVSSQASHKSSALTTLGHIESQGHRYMVCILLHAHLCSNNSTWYCLAFLFTYPFPSFCDTYRCKSWRNSGELGGSKPLITCASNDMEGGWHKLKCSSALATYWLDVSPSQCKLLDT